MHVGGMRELTPSDGIILPANNYGGTPVKLSLIAGTAAILAVTTAASLAAPCDTGSGKDRGASVDPGSKNLAGGQQPASPGTVGAMNNVGANQGLGEKQGATTSASKGSEDPASRNLAGGQQPASPGTVGAMNNAGAHGLSEVFYAYASAANNNGSAFAGYTGVTFADLLGGVAMLLGRFLPLLAALAVAGALAGKRVTPPGPGTMRTDTPTFVVLLIGVIVLVGALTFFPAILLGPIVQSLTADLF